MRAKLKTAATPLIALEGIGKTYRSGTVALTGVDLAVDQGAFLSILGPSGCGKSTLLRIIAGLAEPSGGTLEGVDALKGQISFVFQEPTLMPWARVWDNVYLPLRLSGVPRAKATPRIEEALHSVGLENFAAAFPRELSGGMKMRVSIARALVTRPRLLLLDEPFAALDEITRFKLNEDFLRLWEERQWTVIFVTHSIYESAFLSNRVVVMAPRPGRVIADLPVELPYPRDSALRTSNVYAAVCRALSQRLAEGAP